METQTGLRLADDKVLVPTRLEGMETQTGLRLADDKVLVPTRLEGMETFPPALLLL